MSEQSEEPPVNTEPVVETSQINAEQVAEVSALGFMAIQYMRGENHLRKHRWVKAATAFRSIIGTYEAFRSIIGTYEIANELGIPDVVGPSEIYYKLGLALEHLPHELPEATEALEKAVAADPSNIAARKALARVAVERLDYNQAIHEYTEAFTFIEANREKYTDIEANRMSCDIRARLGSLLIGLERQGEAESILSQAISIYPDNPRALASYAMIAGWHGNEINLRKYLGIALEKFRPGVDEDLIADLVQDASNVKNMEI